MTEERAGGISPAPGRWAIMRTLGWRDWRDLAEAAGSLVWAHALLRFSSPARVIDRATAGRPATVRSTPAGLARVAWLAGVAARHAVPASCLPRSVALARMLARRGASPIIRIGVRRDQGRLEAHAWVVLDGRVINDDESAISQYAPLDRSLTDLTAARPEFR
jgi:hypothetical protein